mgnify:CR=1 FL=1
MVPRGPLTGATNPDAQQPLCVGCISFDSESVAQQSRVDLLTLYFAPQASILSRLAIACAGRCRWSSASATSSNIRQTLL